MIADIGLLEKASRKSEKSSKLNTEAFIWNFKNVKMIKCNNLFNNLKSKVIMNTMILRVKKCGAMTTVQTEKSENDVLDKRTLVLQMLGGKYEDSFVVTALGSLATIEWTEGDLVACSMSFRTHEHNGQVFMDIIANEMVKVKH